MATSVIEKSLAAEVSNMNTSNYSTIDINSGFSGSLRLCRIGKIRMLYGAIKPDNSGANQIVTTLSSNDTPPIILRTSCTGYGVTATGEVELQTNGNVVININAVANNQLKFSITYAIN